jgi:putative phage-type endonuclease
MTVTHLPTRFTIGGSDAAAAAGIDPHKSRVMLWLEKTGRYPREPSEAMMWGTLLESVVFDVLGGQYELERAPDDGFADAERPWRVCHPDAFTLLDGERVTVDIKTANQWAYKWNGAAPLPYQAQLQHNMSLTGDRVGMLATLVNGQKLEVRFVYRDDAVLARLVRLEKEFYTEHLLTDTPPDPDNSDSAREALAAMFPEHAPDRTMRLDRASWGLLQDLRARREQRKAIERQEQGLENLLKLAMGEAEVALSPHDEEVVRWRSVESTRLDVQRLKAERPDVYEQFATTTSTRRFQPL